MKVRVNDQVKIIAGKDKGKEGKVIKTFKNEDKVLVAGINIVKRHMKPSASNETGGIFDRENPIHVSNVKVIKAEKKAEKKPEKKEVKEVKKTTKEPKKTEKKVKESKAK